MKKLLVLLGILAAFSFVACNKEAETPAFDGKIDLTGKVVKNEVAFAKADSLVERQDCRFCDKRYCAR